MGENGLNIESMKRRNRSAVLRLINSDGPISKKDIAERLSLTPAAVTQICGEFMDSGLLAERGFDDEKTVRAGRKKVLIDIDPEYAYVYGINIDPKYTTLVICNLRGEAKICREKKTKHHTLAASGVFVPESEPEKKELRKSENPYDFLREIAAELSDMRKECQIAEEKMAGVGVGIVGIVDKKNGRSIRAYGVWNRPVGVADYLRNLLGVPVRVENNVNAFARAEILFGAGRQYENIFLVKWGPGVGGSIVTDGQLYEGSRTKTAELGHFIVEKEGRRCSCGRRGCLETLVCEQALCEAFPGILTWSGRESDMARLDEVLDLFARSIVNSATILAPDRVILYGKLFAHAWLREKVVAACAAYDEEWDERHVVYSSLAEKESYIGPVAEFIMEEIF